MKSFILLLLCLFALTGCQQLQEFADSVDRANETWSKASTGLADIAGEVRDTTEALVALDTKSRRNLDLARSLPDRRSAGRGMLARQSSAD